MISRHDIQDFAKRLAEKFKPEKVVLFGSYAYGTPTDDSDVDVLVVMSRGPATPVLAGRIREHCRPRFPLDILVRTSAEVRRRLAWHDYFMMDIVEKGVILYDASGCGMASQSRSRRVGR